GRGVARGEDLALRVLARGLVVPGEEVVVSASAAPVHGRDPRAPVDGGLPDRELRPGLAEAERVPRGEDVGEVDVGETVAPVDRVRERELRAVRVERGDDLVRRRAVLLERVQARDS